MSKMFTTTGWKKNEDALIFLVMFICLFLYVNYDAIMFAGYLLFLLVYYLMKQESKNGVYPIFKKKFDYNSIVIGLAFGFAFLYLSAGIWGRLTVQSLGASLIETLNLGSQVQSNPWLLIFIAGPLVGFCEEMFFRGSILPYINRYTKGDMLKSSVLDGIAFGLWHLTVYGLTNSPALVLASVIGSLFSIIVWNKNQTAEAIVGHAMFNSIITAVSVGLISLGVIGL